MLFRFIIALTLTTLFGAKSWACSCTLWGKENVSDLYADGGYVSVWVLPVKGTMVEQNSGWQRFLISYELQVLESFGQLKEKKITAISSIDDGASCGFQLDLGNPHFLTLNRAKDGTFGVSICNPTLPYSLVKAYLETGEDYYLPKSSECRDNNGDIKKAAECSMWKLSHPNNYGSEDSLKYVRQLRVKPKKKRRWWHFKND